MRYPEDDPFDQLWVSPSSGTRSPTPDPLPTPFIERTPHPRRWLRPVFVFTAVAILAMVGGGIATLLRGDPTPTPALAVGSSASPTVADEGPDATQLAGLLGMDMAPIASAFSSWSYNSPPAFPPFAEIDGRYWIAGWVYEARVKDATITLYGEPSDFCLEFSARTTDGALAVTSYTREWVTRTGESCETHYVDSGAVDPFRPSEPGDWIRDDFLPSPWLCFSEVEVSVSWSVTSKEWGFRVLPCDEAHDYEVFSVGFVDLDHFPTDREMEQVVDVHCRAAFELYVGTPIEASSLGPYWYWAPLAYEWDGNARRYFCAVGEPDGATIGSFEGSGL